MGDRIVSVENETEDPWCGGDPRIEVLARINYEHHRGSCSLSASVNREARIFGIHCSTYDQYCRYPHDPVSFVVTGSTLFAACLELYYYRRQEGRKLTLRLEQVEASPPSLAREMTLGLSPLHENVQQLWIPEDYVETLYLAACAKLTGPVDFAGLVEQGI